MNKEALKKNAFWLGCGAGVLVIAGVFFALVWPALGEHDQVRKELDGHLKTLKGLNATGDEIPSAEQLKAYEKRRADLGQELEACKQFYKAYDDVLEAWLPALPTPPPGTLPDAGAFGAEYNARRGKIEEDLQKAHIDIGIAEAGAAGGLPGFGPSTGPKGGFNWEDPTKPPAGVGLKDIQKRLWIRERIKTALLRVQTEARGERVVENLEDTRFLDMANPAPPDDYPGWPSIGAGGAASQEYQLKGAYGTTLTCGVRATVRYPHAAKFVQYLLDSDGVAPKMLVHLRGCRIAMTEPFADEEKREFGYKENENPQQVEAAKRQEMNAEINKPRVVRVYATLEALDFDGDKLAKPFAPPPPP